MTMTQTDTALQFRALHQGPKAFVIANAWDAGSARMLAGLGFAALATSLWRAAMSGLASAAREVLEEGSFGYLDQTLQTAEINRFMRE